MLTQIVVWMNQIAGAIAQVVLAPIAWTPGWLSATLIAGVTGILMLLVFKYTSNQVAIKRTRNRIKSNVYALSLFKDDLRVGLGVQCSLLFEARRLLELSLVPMLVMLVPMCLVLGQLALWYQARPLAMGEEAVVTVHLADSDELTLREIQLTHGPPVEVTVGPVRVPGKRMVCWNVQANESGLHKLVFEAAGLQFTKEIAVGGGYMPVSQERPSGNLSAVLLHPREIPFAADSAVQSIEVAYPSRTSWTTGTDWWMVYWFAVSMFAALAARPFLNVDL